MISFHSPFSFPSSSPLPANNRLMSGAQIKISNNEGDLVERTVTMTGSPGAVSIAQYLIGARCVVRKCTRICLVAVHFCHTLLSSSSPCHTESNLKWLVLPILVLCRWEFAMFLHLFSCPSLPYPLWTTDLDPSFDCLFVTTGHNHLRSPLVLLLIASQILPIPIHVLWALTHHSGKLRQTSCSLTDCHLLILTNIEALSSCLML